MTDKKKNILFIVYAYALFWVLLVIMGAMVVAGVLSTDGIPVQIGIVVGSWTPTFALFILFKYGDSAST